jgi:malonate transporter MadL subunit
MYIPVIVAMSATQNVNAAISGGFVAVLAGIIPTAVAFATIPLIAKLFKNPTSDTTA